MLDMVTTRDPSVARSNGSSRAVRAKWPRWLTPMWVSNPSAVSPRSTAIRPALLASRSRRGSEARPAANFSTDARLARSSGLTSSGPATPSARKAPAAASPAASSRQAMITRAPPPAR